MASTTEDAFSQTFARSLRFSQQDEESDPNLLIRSASAPPPMSENPAREGTSFVNRSDSTASFASNFQESRAVPTSQQTSSAPATQQPQRHQAPYGSGFYPLASQQQAHMASHPQAVYGYQSPGLHPMQAGLGRTPGFFDLSGGSPYLGPAAAQFTSSAQSSIGVPQYAPSPGLGPYTPNLLPQSLLGTPPFMGHQAHHESAGYPQYSPALQPSFYAAGPMGSMAMQQQQQPWMYATQSPSLVAHHHMAPPPLQMPVMQQLPPSALSGQSSASPDSARYLRAEAGPVLGGSSGPGMGIGGKRDVWGAGEQPAQEKFATGGQSGLKKGSLLEELRHKMKQSPTNQRGGGSSFDFHHHPKHQGGHGGMYHGGGGGGHRGKSKSPTNGVAWGLRDILGQVSEFAKDQHGSRFIQQQLESPSVSAEDKQALFEEVLPIARMLCTDVFGNYVFQKLLDPQVGTPAQQEQLCTAALEGNMLELSMHMYGCRVVQKLVEKVFGEEGQALCAHFELPENQSVPGSRLYNPTYQNSLLRELDGSILQCVQDQNGNHVLQKCIEQVRPLERIAFILDAFKGNIASMARHPYGCRVVQRILENCDQGRIREALSELVADIDALVVDSFGNYVVQHVIESQDPYKSSDERKRVLEAVNKNVLSYSTHKFASNVVEKCLQFGTAEERRALIDKMLERSEGRRSCPLVLMMKDPYANYVVQKVIDRAEPDQKEKVVQLVRENAQALKRLTYGKHILARLEKSSSSDGFSHKKRS